MAGDLTSGQLVTIIISAVLIILGIFILLEINKIKDTVLYPLQNIYEKDIYAKIYPQSSQAGTLFLVNAYLTEEKEEQELVLSAETEKYSESLILYDDGKHYDKNASDGIYGGFFDSAKKPYGIYKIKNAEKVLTSFKVDESACEKIYGNYYSKTFNFLIIPYNYSDYEDFKKDAKKIIENENSIINIEPFKSKNDKLSFTLINTTKDFECKIGCYNVSTIVCCNDKAVFEEASRCDYDGIFMLVNSDELCGSASSYAKICAKNPDANLILLHEIGHSFADLADEYVYSKYDIGEINNKNCDIAECKKWKEIDSGCFEGCTYSNLYRPAEKNSIMYDLYPEFNIISQIQINKIFETFFKKEAKRESSDKKSYYVNVKYDNGKIILDNPSLKPVKAPIEYRDSNYELKIRDKNKKEIYSTRLFIPNKLYPLPGRANHLIIKSSIEFPILIQYFDKADMITLYELEKPISSLSVSIFSEECGNNFCENSENHLNCPSDCDINDGFCEESACDPDCKSQKNCLIVKKTSFVLPIVLIIISLLIIIIVISKILLKKVKS